MPKPYQKPSYKIGGAQSLREMTTEEMADDIGPLDPGEVADVGRDRNPGRQAYRQELDAFTAMNDQDKRQALSETWKEIAMGAAVRAKLFVKQCKVTEFSSLQKLISAAATGLEQAFPEKKEAPNTQYIINMFGSLGQRAAAIASPPVPTITVEATEVPWPSSESTSTTTSLSKTTKETSPTTMPSLPSSSTPSPQ